MRKKNHKYIFVVGGVMSGVGKGITSASLGKTLQARGFNVNLVKVDPYLNVDAGTMNPKEHGEVFVLRSGVECDQDMGTYERFLNHDLPAENYLTSGMIYYHVLQKERNLGYRGKCVEAIPHIRDEIIHRYQKAADTNGAEISIIEIGGTIGDYQNSLFMEAARVLKVQHPDDVLFAMVSYLPIPEKVGEMKTRPTQNAARALNSYGIQADLIVGRSEVPLDKKRKEKIAIACNTPTEHVVSAPDIENIYEVPLNLERDKLGEMVLDALKKKPKQKADMSAWRRFYKKLRAPKKAVDVAVVGKYFDTGDFVLTDAYVSVIEAIKFSAAKLGAKANIHWLNAKHFESGDKQLKELEGYDGLIVPGGFGASGIEGKVQVIRYAREHDIPLFGLCYGMQLMVVEYARTVAGLEGAHTAEVDPDAPHRVIDIMPEQKEHMAKEKYGGTMRLGEYPARLAKGTIARNAYKKEEVGERHRHRFEVNPEYIERLRDAGLVFSGTSPDERLMEITELPKKEHPFFLGTQFHPEFTARPLDPHPLYSAFLKAAVARQQEHRA